MPGSEKHIIHGRTPKREFSPEFKIKVLEYLDRGGEVDDCCIKYELRRPELLRIVRGRMEPGRNLRLAGIVEKAKENTLRTRLFERAVQAVEDSMDPLERVIEKSPPAVSRYMEELLPTAVAHLRNRGQNAIKVLEGIGDFRRGGDDIPRPALRQPLFNLPAGTHVAVQIDVTTGGNNGRTLDVGGEAREALESGVETMASEIQVREPSGGDGNDSSLDS